MNERESTAWRGPNIYPRHNQQYTAKARASLSVSALHDTATSMNGTSSAALEAKGATALLTQSV